MSSDDDTRLSSKRRAGSACPDAAGAGRGAAPADGVAPPLPWDRPTVARDRHAGAGREPALEASRPPARVGDYLMGGILAEGGFGVVYRAAHAERGAPAAIKIPHVELAAHPDILARFEREIEVVRRLRHPNVVRILDCGRLDDGRPYFAMELLSGVDLDAHIAARGRLGADEALALLEPVCAAIEAAHAQGIVHRDIKPSNVFLAEDDGRRRVVLLDFGVAKLLDAPGPALTTSRHVIGTLAYISPEQLAGQPVDPRTDVYALGALLYAMLVGDAPFQAAAYPALRQLMLHGPAPRPSLRAPVHVAFDEVVRRAMATDRAARHPSVGAFLAHARWAAAQARGAAVAPREGSMRRALGVYVEILTAPGALEAPDARLVVDFEGILPAVREHLAGGRLSLAVETGNGALFVAELPPDPARDEEARGEAIRIMRSLHERLEERATRDPRVRIHISAHAGAMFVSDTGDPIGGELLDLSAWLPEEVPEGSFASPAMLAGLDGGAAPEEASGPLRRIA
jgi:serine/threonine-protein kinase